jgi:hypothetical protein
MKLNRLERHTAYIIMLAEAESGNIPRNEDGLHGLCFCTWFWFGLPNSDRASWLDNILTFFPELWAKRTSDSLLAGWFPGDESGWQKRIELLKQCIEETY